MRHDEALASVLVGGLGALECQDGFRYLVLVVDDLGGVFGNGELAFNTRKGLIGLVDAQVLRCHVCGRLLRLNALRLVAHRPETDYRLLDLERVPALARLGDLVGNDILVDFLDDVL